MTTSQDANKWPNNRTDRQTNLELAAHIIYRDTVLLINPHTPLEADFAQRLRLLRLSSKKHPVTREFLNELRDLISALKQDFYSENFRTCLDVIMLGSRLENMRDFEQDMKSRLKGRLRAVRMVQKWDGNGEVWVWALELNEDVREGLGEARTRSKKKYRPRRSKRDEGVDGEAMEIDG